MGSEGVGSFSLQQVLTSAGSDRPQPTPANCHNPVYGGQKVPILCNLSK